MITFKTRYLGHHSLLRTIDVLSTKSICILTVFSFFFLFCLSLLFFSLPTLTSFYLPPQRWHSLQTSIMHRSSEPLNWLSRNLLGAFRKRQIVWPFRHFPRPWLRGPQREMAQMAEIPRPQPQNFSRTITTITPIPWDQVNFDPLRVKPHSWTAILCKISRSKVEQHLWIHHPRNCPRWEDELRPLWRREEVTLEGGGQKLYQPLIRVALGVSNELHFLAPYQTVTICCFLYCILEYFKF